MVQAVQLFILCFTYVLLACMVICSIVNFRFSRNGRTTPLVENM